MTYLIKINKIAKDIVTTVEKEQHLPNRTDYSKAQYTYLMAKAVLNPNKDITSISIKKASNPTGDYFSRQINKNGYSVLAKRLVDFVKKTQTLPNYITWGEKRVDIRLACYVFAQAVNYNRIKGHLPAQLTINSKVFTKPSETVNEVYEYFKDVFGNFGDTIDGALRKIDSKGYGYYYDDVYSNHESINRMKNGRGVNCTDSCQVFYNIMEELIRKGKYQKVECLHIQCQGGDGHVRLRITLNDGSKIYRDPAAVLNGDGVTSNWCMNGTLIAINPSWFMANLHR